MKIKKHHEYSIYDIGLDDRIRPIVMISISLITIIITVYMQVKNHEFLNYGDSSYVTKNLHVTSGINVKNIIWAFTSVEDLNWHPITWLSHMADAQFFGLDPRMHHLTSVLIHSVSSLLLLLLLLRFSGSLWQSSFVAVMFALHPLHVESVAWIAERKDVLSAFFWFLTLFFYSEYVSMGKLTYYMLSLLTFVLGLMSNPVIVTLPAILLLMDYWPLFRYRHEEQEKKILQNLDKAIVLINEKIPFITCSLLSCAVTGYAQYISKKSSSSYEIPLQLRIDNALITYVKYINKTIWPHDLAVYYPFSFSIPLWQIIGSSIFLLIVSATVIIYGRRYPYLPVGWFWYLITLLPVIGIIHRGSQSMADRYTYIPLIGLFIMAAWGVANCAKGLEGILAILASVIITFLTASTWQQLGYWQDDISLFQHTLQCTTGSYIAHSELGYAFAGKGNLDAAIREYNEALYLAPKNSDAHNNMGSAFARKGDVDAAIIEFNEALDLAPNNSEAHNNLGSALESKGDVNGAIKEFQEALRLNSNNSGAQNNLKKTLAAKKK